MIINVRTETERTEALTIRLLSKDFSNLGNFGLSLGFSGTIYLTFKELESLVYEANAALYEYAEREANEFAGLVPTDAESLS